MPNFITFYSDSDIMPIPDLNQDYLPIGVYNCTFEELHEKFGGTSRRKELIDKFERYIQKVQQAGIKGWIIINGSFVTSKKEPGDIDIILVRKKDNFLASLNKPMSGLEQYVLSKDIVQTEFELHLFSTIESDQATKNMTSFFSRIKGKGPNDKKGLVRLAI